MSSIESHPDVYLNELIPDSKLVADIERLLSEEPYGTIELDSGSIRVPQGCKFEIVSKSCISRRFDYGFGSCFSGLVAIGGVASSSHGIIEAEYCFAVVWYSANGELITVDFSSEWPQG